MAGVSSNSNRLLKNTLFLYLRTFVTLAIGLFTSRVILNTLGILDYGTYNVVGGFVAMFSIVGGSLVSATQRFLNYELGRNSESKTYEVFGAAMGIHIVLAVILLLLFESFGLWFLNNKMVFPNGRMDAVNWVFQCSIFTFLVNILSSPYNAAIIAHERMSAFAYISLLDVSLKLAIVYLLCISPVDKLVMYAVLLCLEALFIRLIYDMYCVRNFSETKFHVSRDKALYREMVGFSSMTFLGQFANVLSNQGVNILLNMFFGVAVNAARGITVQVNNAVIKFVTDFTTALNPQITKRYASGNVDSMVSLCYRGSKLSYFLFLFFAIPIFFKTPLILELWLKVFPTDAVIFIRLTMLTSLCTVLSTPLVTAILATGNVKKMCLWIGIVHLLVLPICYLVLLMGGAPYTVYFVAFIIDCFLLFLRLLILCKLINRSPRKFLTDVLLRIILVSSLCFIWGYIISNLFATNFFGLMCFSFATFVANVIFIYCFGMISYERQLIKSYIATKLKK